MTYPGIGTAEVIKANALDLPLGDASVDLVITSPPYFALRSYRDDGEHYDGQLGSEPTPADFIDALIAATKEMVRVLKPSGSIWVNLGDKYAGSGGHNNGNLKQGYVDRRCRTCGAVSSSIKCRECGDTTLIIRTDETRAALKNQATRRNAPDAYNKASDGIRAKSLMGLPWRYAIRCIDELGLILRAEVIWDKPNGLPESVGDRVRRSHEQWFHFVKSPTYFAGIDEVREAHSPISKQVERDALKAVTNGGNYTTKWPEGTADTNNSMNGPWGEGLRTLNPLGKLPGSVWRIATEPLKIPDELGVQHFAAFPSEWPSRIIRGWSPSGICTACGEGRVPVVDRSFTGAVNDTTNWVESRTVERGWGDRVFQRGSSATITGYACKCDKPTAPTRPAVVLDPFGGTGTVAMVAKALGRHGVSVDLSTDYCRVAEWRTNDRESLFKIRAKVYGARRYKRPKMQNDAQQSLFNEPVDATRYLGRGSRRFNRPSE